MADQRPPHPGAQPDSLRFPFGEAAQAARQARALATDLNHLRRRVDSGMNDLAGSRFEGRFADWMLRSGGEVHEDLAAMARDLEDQAERIEDVAASAERRIQDRNDSIEQWEMRVRRWRDWEPASLEPA